MEEQTSKEVAAIAAKIMRDPNATKEEKSVAASALTQAPDKPPDFESEADLADD